MLKSTHRSVGLQPSSSLPEGWTEHKAPSGHTYYYNKATKSSTYTRPTLESIGSTQDEEPLFAEEAGPDPVVQAALRAQEDFARNTGQYAQPGHFTGGKSYQQRSRRGHGGDRPKKKVIIPDCVPWLLVTTKFGRRFVHNTETKQSLWKFPQDVMMAVITLDKMEWEKTRSTAEQQDTAAVDENAPKTATTVNSAQVDTSGDRAHDYDSSEYEEVEVTDDEGEPTSTYHDGNKRPRFSASPAPAAPNGVAELTEDDIAYQLAAMEADEYSDEPYPDSNPDADEEANDSDPGLPLTASDNLALFRSLLDSTSTSPYAPFESLLTLPQVVEDTRWVSLPNMSSRREAFTSWSRDRVAELTALKAQQQLHANADEADDTDPRVQYLAFLANNASTKLYWPEFKRKFKKEGVMRAYEPPEKEREKLYREFVAKLKLGPGQRRKELAEVLKAADREDGKEDGRGRSRSRRVPLKAKRDLKYWVVGEKERDEVVQAWLGLTSPS